MIVFLGDSLTEWAGNWNQLLNTEAEIRNMGIAGNTGFDIQDRLDGVLDLQPNTVFLMFGANDIFQGYNTDIIIATYREILSSILISTGGKVIIQSTLPVSNQSDIFRKMNESITDINKNLILLAGEMNLDYLDLHSKFKSENELNPKYTTDGVHLSDFGYEIWSGILLEKYPDLFPPKQD
ncbi:MAG: hypothetical protein H7A24_17565 [Leptospiraceae bacterium]|nr:hypothetical protein [Leptospiraceae bacterium]